MKRFFSVRFVILLIVGLAIAYYFHITRKRNVDGNAELKVELSDLKSEWLALRLQEGESAYAKEKLIEVNKRIESLNDEAAEIRQSVSTEQLAVESLEKRKKALFFEYREQVRRQAKGLRFDKMTTPQGKRYENIEITEVRPDGISFRFGSDGSASLLDDVVFFILGILLLKLSMLVLKLSIGRLDYLVILFSFPQLYFRLFK